MSLTDLKKSSKDKGKKKKFTVDEFISDSENYAKGSPELVSNDIDKQQDLARAIAGAKELVEAKAEQKFSKEVPVLKTVTDKKVRHIKKKSAVKHDAHHQKFRHATFTLSEEVIQQLQYLSDETHLAKSHIIRILINELDDKEKIAQLKEVLSTKNE